MPQPRLSPYSPAAALGAPTGATACANVAAASPSHPFLSSAPPHEYTLGTPTGATACGNAAAASPSFSSSLSPPPLDSWAPPQQYFSSDIAHAAKRASLAAVAIHDCRSHGRRLGRKRRSRVYVPFLLAVASLHRVRHRSSRVAVASLRLLEAAAAITFPRCFAFFDFTKIRSGPKAVSDGLSCSKGDCITTQPIRQFSLASVSAESPCIARLV
jgi:hypothetical protein